MSWPSFCTPTPALEDVFPWEGGFRGSWFQDHLGSQGFPRPGSDSRPPPGRCVRSWHGPLPRPPSDGPLPLADPQASGTHGPSPSERGAERGDGVILGSPSLRRRGSFVTVGKSVSSPKLGAGGGLVSTWDVLAPSRLSAVLSAMLTGPGWGGQA